FLFSPGTSPFEHFLNPFKTAAESLRVEAIAAPVNDRAELQTVLATLAREPNTGLVVMPGPFPLAHREAIISLAAGYHLPAVYPTVSSVISAASSPTEMTLPIIIDARPHTSTAF